MRNLLEDLLSVAGIAVTTCSTEAEALKALRDDPAIDVVVCPAPPVGAKHSLVAKIRSSNDVNLKPVICLSPARGLQDRGMAYESGASDYVELPVSPVTLEERVRKWASRGQHRDY